MLCRKDIAIHHMKCPSLVTFRPVFWRQGFTATTLSLLGDTEELPDHVSSAVLVKARVRLRVCSCAPRLAFSEKPVRPPRRVQRSVGDADQIFLGVNTT